MLYDMILACKYLINFKTWQFGLFGQLGHYINDFVAWIFFHIKFQSSASKLFTLILIYKHSALYHNVVFPIFHNKQLLQQTPSWAATSPSRNRQAGTGSAGVLPLYTVHSAVWGICTLWAVLEWGMLHLQFYI